MAWNKKELLSVQPGAKRISIRHPEVRGLGVIIQPSGERSFYWTRKHKGRFWRKRIAAVEDVNVRYAEDAAKTYNERLAVGQHPYVEADSSMTFRDAWIMYRDTHLKPKGSRLDSFTSFVNLHTKPINGLPLGEVTRADILKVRNQAAARAGKVTANRVASFIRSVFYWHMDAETYQGTNPAARLGRLEERSRTRYILPAEMPAFLKALEAVDQVWRDALLVALLTGARWNNTASMRWDEIGADGIWRPRRSKSGEPLAIPITEPVRDILGARRAAQRPPSEWVFPSRLSKVGHIVRPQAAWKIIREESGLKDIRIHDLRRTMGSWLTEGGASLQVVGDALGHADITSTAIYARLSKDATRAAMERAAGAMLTGEQPCGKAGDPK